MNKGYLICTEQVLLPIMTTNYREIVFHSEILKRVKINTVLRPVGRATIFFTLWPCSSNATGPG